MSGHDGSHFAQSVALTGRMSVQPKNELGAFNEEILLFMIALGSGLFLCGLSVACCIVRKYKKEKEALMK